MFFLQYESKLSIADRVAFACLFLPDSHLMQYLHRLQAEVIVQGDLSGVILTGNKNSISMFYYLSE